MRRSETKTDDAASGSQGDTRNGVVDRLAFEGGIADIDFYRERKLGFDNELPRHRTRFAK
jgi:hypothetical protein